MLNREEVIELLRKIKAEFVPADSTDKQALKLIRDAAHALEAEVETEKRRTKIALD